MLYNIIQAYILCGVILSINCYQKTHKQITAPLYAYLIIILIWPYQLYLQNRYKK